jgi:hypothetical protein
VSVWICHVFPVIDLEHIKYLAFSAPIIFIACVAPGLKAECRPSPLLNAPLPVSTKIFLVCLTQTQINLNNVNATISYNK